MFIWSKDKIPAFCFYELSKFNSFLSTNSLIDVVAKPNSLYEFSVWLTILNLIGKSLSELQRDEPLILNCLKFGFLV